MKNFGYCIWLTSLKKKIIYGIIILMVFKVICNIKYNLNRKNAKNFIKLLEKEKKDYRIKLSDKLYYSS